MSGTQRLARFIGKGRALDMILTGKIVDGVEAERIGLASYCMAIEELESTVHEIADEISKKGPVAVSLFKKAVHKGYDIDRDAAL